MKYLIWDFEGTLGYRLGNWSGTLVEVLQREAPECHASVEDIRLHLQDGFPWHHPEQPHKPHQPAEVWWEALTPVFERAFRCSAGLAAREVGRLAQHVRAVYLDPARWRFFEDTIPCLRALTVQGWQHVVLSNHVPELPTIIHALGLAPHIVRVFTSAETGFEKPHPQAFGHVLATLPDAATVWMVGNSLTADVAGAQAVGLPAILVRTKHPQVEPCCETLLELPGLLQGTSGGAQADGVGGGLSARCREAPDRGRCAGGW
jgi:putative hydrolase of the HAD superfamily